MTTQTLIYLLVGASFALYIGIAIWSRAGSTGEFYVAGRGVNPVVNGMATAADWMSAASFISMAGIIAFAGYDGSVYLMGWTGGYVLLALMLAPYLRQFGQFTVPDFIGTRYYSEVLKIRFWHRMRASTMLSRSPSIDVSTIVTSSACRRMVSLRVSPSTDSSAPRLAVPRNENFTIEITLLVKTSASPSEIEEAATSKYRRAGLQSRCDPRPSSASRRDRRRRANARIARFERN